MQYCRFLALLVLSLHFPVAMSLPRCSCGFAVREFVAELLPSSRLASIDRHFLSYQMQRKFSWQKQPWRLTRTASFSTFLAHSNKPSEEQDDASSEASARKRRKILEKSVEVPGSSKSKHDSPLVETSISINAKSPFLGLDSQLTQPLEELLSLAEHQPDEKVIKMPIRSIRRRMYKTPLLTYTEDPLLVKLRRSLFVFTDGSCPKNRNVSQLANNPAGWAFLALRPSHKFLQDLHSLQSQHAGTWTAEMRAKLLQWDKKCLSHFVDEYLRDEMTAEVVDRCFGPVFLQGNAATDIFALGASLGSNNTAELSAFLEAILYLLKHCSLLEPTGHCSTSKEHEEEDVEEDLVERVVFCYDSEYAAKSLTGEFNGSKNKELILHGRQLLQQLRHKIQALHTNNDSGSNSDSSNNSSLKISPDLLDRFLTTNSFTRLRPVPSAPSAGDTGVTMVHVKGHSGHSWNEAADQLALLGANGYIMRNSRFAKVQSKHVGSFALVESEDEVV